MLVDNSCYFDEKNETHVQICNEFKAKKESIETSNEYVFSVTQLEEIYTRMHNTLWFNIDDKLKQLLECYSRLFPHEYNNILKSLEVYKFNESNKILLQGEVQSGKTSMMILTALCYLSYGRDVVAVCRPRTNDVNQFTRRFNEIVRLLKREYNITHPNFVISTKNKKYNHPSMFVVNYSNSNLKKVMSRLSDREMKRAVMYVDEADVRNDTSDTHFIRATEQMGTTIFVSATVQDILVSNWNIKGADIAILSPDRTLYKGVLDIQIHLVDSTLTINENIFYGLCDISVEDSFKEVCPFHPRIILLAVERTNVKMRELCTQIVNDAFPIDGVLYKFPTQLREDLCVMQYDGDGIDMFYNGVRTIYRHESIGDVFNILCQQNPRPKNIIIVSGDMAARGLNFASNGNADPRDNWHITHQLFLKSNKTTTSTTIQGLRLLGNYKDAIVPQLYTTQACADKITKGYTLTNKMVNCIVDKENSFYSTDYSTMNTNRICKRLPIRKQDKPVNFLRGDERSKLHLVRNSETSILDPLPEEEVKEEEVPDIEDEMKMEDGIRKINPSSLSSKKKDIYNLILNYITSDKRRQWIRRTLVIEESFPRKEHANVRGHMHFMCSQHGIRCEEDSPGLLFKKVNELWFIRLN